MKKALLGKRARKDVLGFAFLVYQKAGRRGERIWFARSVLTGHVAHGSTPDQAVDSLQAVIDVSIHTAGQYGQTPQDWYRAQRPDAEQYVLEFCQLVAKGVEQMLKKTVSRTGCVLEARIQERAA